MSKKIFLKKSYADAVKGIDRTTAPSLYEDAPSLYEDEEVIMQTGCTGTSPTKTRTSPRKRTFQTPTTSLIDIGDSELTFGEGESVLKPNYFGFRYSEARSCRTPKLLNTSPKKPKALRVAKVSPTKFHNQSPIVISDSSSEEVSPRKIQRRSKIKPLSSKDGDTSDETFLVTSISSNGNCPVSVPSSPSIQGNQELQPKRKLFSTEFSDDSDDSLPSLGLDVGEVTESVEFTLKYENDPLLPVYKSLKTGIKTKEAVSLLLKKIPTEHLARTVPNSIDKNVTFVFSADSVGHWKNALCDGMGRWDQKGTERQYVKTDNNGDSMAVVISSLTAPGVEFCIIRRKYQNASYKALHRVVITLENLITSEFVDQFLVQYYFEGQEKRITIAAHGNSKSTNSYQRTNESTKQRINELCKNRNSTPKNVLHSIIEEQGGLEKVHGASFIPRNRQQISNMKRKYEDISSNDPLLECIDLAKQQEKSKHKFVRDVRAGPEFTMLLCTDRQLQDLEKFCTNSKEFSVAGVDTTFNIGQYFVTVLTYRHLMLQTNKGVEPVFVGPILLHQRKSFDSYFKLSSGIVQECKQLLKLKVFGTDGDVNLTDAFLASFPESIHLLCDLHMSDNIDRHLRKLGITGKTAKLFRKDIFGDVDGTTKIIGLVDAISKEDFDDRLRDLKGEWIGRHQQGEVFYTYFVEYKSELIKNCMTAEIRSLCGLGFPPKTYTQNANECMNSVLKKDIAAETPTQKLDAFEFAKVAEKFVKRQESEIKMAIIGKGQYKLKEKYQHLKVEETNYWRKTEVQREKVFQKFQQEQLKGPEEERVTRVGTEITEVETEDNIRLNVTAENCEILNVPQRILEDLLGTANDLLAAEGSVAVLPGCRDNTRFMVANPQNLNDPHMLKYTVNTQTIACDKKCSRHNSFSICEHSVAIASYLGIMETYLKRYRQKALHRQNITGMSNTNMPASRGKKGTKSTQRRKGAANKEQVQLETFAEAKRSEIFDVQPFHLTFCAGLIKKCYGCNQEFTDRIRKPPNDLLLKRFDFRKYISPQSKCQKTTNTLQSTYFHLNKECARRVHPKFEIKDVIVHDEIKEGLTDGHKTILRKLGVTY